MPVSRRQEHYGTVRVLVVEDQKVLADRIAEGLRDQGMAVDVAYDGEAAIEVTAFTAYDVIVLDRDLPRVHGDAVCASLVGSGRWPGAARRRRRWRSAGIWSSTGCGAASAARGSRSR
jgi:CheY-like chemotaxis protein